MVLKHISKQSELFFNSFVNYDCFEFKKKKNVSSLKKISKQSEFFSSLRVSLSRD